MRNGLLVERLCVSSMFTGEDIIVGHMFHEKSVKQTNTIEKNISETPKSNIASVYDKNEVDKEM